MHRNYTPRALNRDLHQESAKCDERNARAETPKRNYRKCQQTRGDNCPSPSYSLRKRSENNSADDRPDICDDRNQAHGMCRQLALRLKKRRIEILCSMTEKVERC